MSTITREQAQKIIEAADEVITALAGTNEDVHPESDSMLRLWDDLNDRYAPPEVVRELARIALASLEAEPAIHRWRRVTVEPYDPYPWHYGNFIGFSQPVEDEYFYSAPPAPVSVTDIKWPEEKFCPAEYAGSQLWEETEIWNKAIDACKAACRAAMLQRTEPVTILSGNFESFISWLTSGDGIPDWLINGDKIDDEKVSFLLKVYRAGAESKYNGIFVGGDTKVSGNSIDNYKSSEGVFMSDVKDGQNNVIKTGVAYQYSFAYPGANISCVVVKNIKDEKTIEVYDVIFKMHLKLKPNELFRPLKSTWDKWPEQKEKALKYGAILDLSTY